MYISIVNSLLINRFSLEWLEADFWACHSIWSRESQTPIYANSASDHSISRPHSWHDVVWPCT